MTDVPRFYTGGLDRLLGEVDRLIECVQSQSEISTEQDILMLLAKAVREIRDQLDEYGREDNDY